MRVRIGGTDTTAMRMNILHYFLLNVINILNAENNARITDKTNMPVEKNDQNSISTIPTQFPFYRAA